MSDQMQNVINRLSLVMTIPEDIVKACRQAELPPAMAETLMRFHNQQVELEKAINTLRPIITQMAILIERQADVSKKFSGALGDMASHIGYGLEEAVNNEEIGQD